MEMDALQLVKDLMNAQGIDVNVLKPPYDNIAHFDGGIRRQLFTDFPNDTVIKQLAQDCVESTLYLITDQFEVHFVIFRVPACIKENTVDTFVTIGPYLLEVPDRVIPIVVERNKLPLYHISELKHYYYGVPVIADNSALEALLVVLAQHLFGGNDKFSIHRTGMWFDGVAQPIEYKIEPQDMFSMSIVEERYRHEDALLEAIEQGNLQKAMICKQAFRKFHMEPRYSDRIREMRNYLIILNTICRKAVQKADVHPAHIDSVSATFAKRIEAGNFDELTHLTDKMLRKYCMLVQNHSLRGYSHMIQQAMNYIEFNLSEPLSLRHMAKIILVNSSYLSTQFKKETGKTLTDYVNQKRIQSSLILLSTTNLPIQMIAERVGVYDENYFSKLFKRIVNKTPREYRNAFR